MIVQLKRAPCMATGPVTPDPGRSKVSGRLQLSWPSGTETPGQDCKDEDKLLAIGEVTALLRISCPGMAPTLPAGETQSPKA